jgi:hypothetical protein
MCDVEYYIARHADFNAGDMRGMRHGTITAEIAQLPEEWAEQLIITYAVSRLAYVVFSYNIPIAWVDTEGGVTIPPARFSSATTQHQYRAADALAMSDRITHENDRHGGW